MENPGEIIMRSGTLILTIFLVCAGGLAIFLLSNVVEAELIICEVYDEGTKGEDQFVELCNPDEEPVDLSQYYLSVLESPAGEGDEFGPWDLDTLDYYDKNGNDLLDDDEFVAVQDSEIDLGTYKEMGIYLKSNNSQASLCGWSFNGDALDPVSGMSTQIPYDNDNTRYVFDKWTLASLTKDARNIVPIPDFESSAVVINEVNPGYVELYNTGLSEIDLEDYKVAGYRNAYTIPAGRTIEAGGYYSITDSWIFIADNGGDIKLLDELGVFIDVISWEDQSRAEDSYAARHIDGLGNRGIYLENDANQDLDDKPLFWWKFNVAPSEEASNYPGHTILVDGLPEAVNYLTGPGGEYENDGLIEGAIEDIDSIPSWDIILYSGTVGEDQASILEGYLNCGGRLYLEEDDFRTILRDYPTLYDMLHIEAKDFPAGTIGTRVLAGDLFAEGIELKYGGAVSEHIDPNDEGMRVMYMKNDPSDRFTAAYIQDPVEGYRMVSSALEFGELESDSNEPEDFLEALIEWFLVEDLNNAPVIELIDGGQVGSTALTANDAKLSKLGWLGWENEDPDYWDQDIWITQDPYDHDMYKFIEFTVYMDQDEEKVKDLDEACEIVAVTNTTFYLPSGLEPGQYFWTVRAEDKFAAKAGADDEWGDPIVFNFLYDNEKPEMLSIKPYFKDSRSPANSGEEMMGYYVEHSMYPTFGMEGSGKPEGILLKAGDNGTGLSFDSNPQIEIGLKFVSIEPGVPGKTFEEVTLLTRTGEDVDTLHGTNEAEFILDLQNLLLDGGDALLDDEGTLRNGRYTVMYDVYDLVGNYIEGNLLFTVDGTAPDPVTGMELIPLDQHIYENTGVKFLKAGENYTIQGIGPTTAADGTLELVEFYMFDKLTNPNTIFLGNFTENEIASGEDTKSYSVKFQATEGYEFFYARCRDRAGNYVMSDILGATGGIVVDGYAPTKPYALSLRPDTGKYVELQGWARDSQVAGKTSKMSYVLVYLNGEPVRWEEDGNYEWLGGREYKAGDEMKVQVIANQFMAKIPLTPISSRDGDVRNVIQGKGVDNVGNVGNLSDPDQFPAIRLLDPQKSLNVAMSEEAFDLNPSQDQLSDISVTFLQFDSGDFEYHLIEMYYRSETLDIDSSAMAMQGSWTVESDVDGDFTARVRIQFNHPSISYFEFSKLELVTRKGTMDPWTVLEDAVFIHQEANPAAGIPELWYVEATVHSFSDFAIIQGKPDLQIVDTHVFANPVLAGQKLKITATVRNVGEFAPEARKVKIRVYYLDEEGAESTIGWMNFEDPILPGVENQQTEDVFWETSVIINDLEKFYIRFKVDPDAMIAEANEGNNNAFMDEDRDGQEDRLTLFEGSFPKSPSITSPEGYNPVLSGIVTISVELPMANFTAIYQNHVYGSQMNIIEVERAFPLISLRYVLRDTSGTPVPGVEGRVVDIYELSIEDEGVNLAFHDADRDGDLTAGDSFILKDLAHDGAASEGFTLELLPNPEFASALVFTADYRVIPWEPLTTLDGNGPWSYQWDTTTLEDGEYNLTTSHVVDGVNFPGYLFTVTIDNEADNQGEDKDDEFFLLKKTGPLPLIVYILLLAVVFGGAGMFFQLRGQKKEKTTSQGPGSGTGQGQLTNNPGIPGGPYAPGQYQNQMPQYPAPQQFSPAPQAPPTLQQPYLTPQSPPTAPGTSSWHCFRCGKDVGLEHSFCLFCGTKRQDQNPNSEVNP